MAIDLLPDRSVETVAAWFRKHPEIELISRDGSSEYAAAALKGAPRVDPSGRQVAYSEKPWESAQEPLSCSLHHPSQEENAASRHTEEADLPTGSLQKALTTARAPPSLVHRDERLARYEQVMTLIKQGLTHRAIADQVGVGLTTIQNWLKAGSFPERKPREQSSQLDPYRAYAQKRRSEGYHNLMGIYRELQAQGYQGSYENVRVQFADPSQKAGTKRGAGCLPTEALPSSRQASRLFLCRTAGSHCKGASHSGQVTTASSGG
jgi:hypothetical protein